MTQLLKRCLEKNKFEANVVVFKLLRSQRVMRMDAMRIMLEYYKSHEVEGTLRKYVEKEAKTDPAFIPWLFYYADNIKEFDNGMNDEQRFEYNVWLDNLPRKRKRLMGEGG